jgi:hypothetical protein
MVTADRYPSLETSTREIRDLANRLAAHSRKVSERQAKDDMVLAAQMLRRLLPKSANKDESRKSAVTNPGHTGSDGPDENPALVTAVAQMCDMLARISDFHASHPDMRRRTAIYAIHAISGFFMRINRQQAINLMAPLDDVSEALRELERGNLPTLFKCKRKPARPPDSFGRELIKGAAAAAMTFLMEAGLPRKEAARRVADELQRRGVKLGGNRHLGSGTVASWRDQAKTAAPEGTMVARAYHRFRKGGRHVGPMAPRITMKLNVGAHDLYIKSVLRQLRTLLAIQHQN